MSADKVNEWMKISKLKFDEYYQKSNEAATSFLEDLAKTGQQALKNGSEKLAEYKKRLEELKLEEKKILEALTAKWENMMNEQIGNEAKIAELKKKFEEAIEVEKAKSRKKWEALKKMAFDNKGGDEGTS